MINLESDWTSGTDSSLKCLQHDWKEWACWYIFFIYLRYESLSSIINDYKDGRLRCKKFLFIKIGFNGGKVCYVSLQLSNCRQEGWRNLPKPFKGGEGIKVKWMVKFAKNLNLFLIHIIPTIKHWKVEVELLPNFSCLSAYLPNYHWRGKESDKGRLWDALFENFAT